MHSLDYEYTDKEISPWGGLRLVQDFYQRCGLRSMIDNLNMPCSGSNRGYTASSLVEGFMVSVILGAKRFSHSGTIRNDDVIKKIFGWKKGMASQSTFSRFFRRFDFSDNDFYMQKLNKQWFEKVSIDKHTIDIDSSVITRYGSQEGVEIGYNPKRHGRGSHHPLIAFSAEAKMVIQAWMRTGDSASSTKFKEFLNEVVAVLPKKKIGLIRADSGFSGNIILDHLEKEKLNYIIACRMHSGLSNQIFEQNNWQKVASGISCCSFQYQAGSWKAPRRIVVVRKNENIRPKSGGKTLFPEYDNFSRYRYSAFVTSMDLSAELIWSIYKQRGEAENQIKELKYNYGMEGFCSESFSATEAAFRWVMVAYNLMSMFRQKVITQKSSPTLTTMKFQCIAIGSYIVTKGRSMILKLAVKNKRRDYIDKLFINLDKIAVDGS